MRQYVYLGPTVRGIAKHNQIYLYEPTEIMQRLGDKTPMARYLFIPIDKVAEAKAEIDEEGSLAYIAYKKIEKMKESGNV